MAGIELVSCEPRKDGGAFCFRGATPDELAGRFEQFFTQRGYRLESGTPHDGVYGIGSDMLRLLFGAFCKRYKFSLNMQATEGVVWVNIGKGMAGAMGGLWGYAAMKRETTRIVQDIEAHFRAAV